MDRELEAKARACEVCQQTGPLDKPVPIHQWPEKPWPGSTCRAPIWQVQIDAYSKWIESKIISIATSCRY